MQKVVMGQRYYFSAREFVLQARAEAENKMWEIAVAGAQSGEPLSDGEKTELAGCMRAVINAYAAQASNRRSGATSPNAKHVIGFSLEHDAELFEDVVSPARLRVLPPTMSFAKMEVTG